MWSPSLGVSPEASDLLGPKPVHTQGSQRQIKLPGFRLPMHNFLNVYKGLFEQTTTYAREKIS